MTEVQIDLNECMTDKIRKRAKKLAKRLALPVPVVVARLASELLGDDQSFSAILAAERIALGPERLHLLKESQVVEPTAEEPEPETEQPKAEEPEPETEQPKAEEPEPETEQPKAEEPEVVEFPWKDIKGLGEKGINNMLPMMAKQGVETLQQAYDDFDFKKVDGIGQKTVDRIYPALKEALGITEDEQDTDTSEDEVEELLDEAEDEKEASPSEQMDEVDTSNVQGVQAAFLIFEGANGLSRDDRSELLDELARDVGFSPADESTYEAAVQHLRDNLPVEEDQVNQIFKLGKELGEGQEDIVKTRPEVLFGKGLDDLTFSEANHYITELEADLEGETEADTEGVDELNAAVDDGFFN